LLKRLLELNKSVPPPNLYKTKSSFEIKSKHGQFSKLVRTTFTSKIEQESIKTPGPGRYDPKPSPSKKIGFSPTSKRNLGFYDEALYKGLNNPLSFNPKYALVHERAVSTQFKNYAKARMNSIIKEKEGTTPDLYETLTSFKRTQEPKRSFKFDNYKIP